MTPSRDHIIEGCPLVRFSEHVSLQYFRRGGVHYHGISACRRTHFSTLHAWITASFNTEKFLSNYQCN